MGPWLARFLDFDLDTYLNPYLPHSRLSRLPEPISRWLGYRNEDYKERPVLLVCAWSFVGTLASLLLVGALYRYAPGLTKYKPPVIIASLGASAILDFNAIRTPLAQPRNAFFGQTLSALVGVAIAKGFQRSSDFDNLQWIAGAVCCAVASIVMSITGTVHPPGGATAVLAATNAEIIRMGWIYIPFIMLSSALMLTVALLINNIQRSYPVYWWTARDLKKPKDLGDLEKVDSNDSAKALRKASSTVSSRCGGAETISISAHHIYWPDSLQISDEQFVMLQRLQAELRHGLALDERPSVSGQH
ncbi:hypothetical protein AAFC00_003493 [Neodothiora populina]|uniref:HPP transmembrane region domain-containing protein n=1 Tax=Neodothiora populina TaxID=2781224 RepID=A0ABR3PES1_9PEZI